MQAIFSKDVADAVSAVFAYDDRMSGLLETNWSDETVRKMTRPSRPNGTKGKLIVDRQELKLYLRSDCRFENYEEGWNSRYITDLQSPVRSIFAARSTQPNSTRFSRRFRSGNMAHENSFASAYETDRVLNLITEANEANGGGGRA